ncbi:hypothetical protein EMCRGX_G016080 [Ephydatia muelleri]
MDTTVICCDLTRCAPTHLASVKQKSSALHGANWNVGAFRDEDEEHRCRQDNLLPAADIGQQTEKKVHLGFRALVSVRCHS